jgi:MarR family 2-MHQ and catechol resistance regulon transcriptional repressor
MSLKTELGLRRDFHSAAHEALLNIDFTAAQVKKKADVFFKAHSLTDVQFNLLMLLKYHSGDNGGLTQVQLSRMMLVNRANITSLVDRMEKAELVLRTPVPGDRRYNVVRLTERGQDILARAEEDYRRKVSELMGVCSEERLRQLIDALERIRGNLGVLDRP